MRNSARTIVILLADDDPDDRMLTQEALEESSLADQHLHFAEDGEELLDYLRRRGKYADRSLSPRPDLILLDLNMPRKDGREALREIKSDAGLKQIPVVVLTTSNADQDILQTYELGASSYITKPARFESLVQVMQTLGRYWFETVQLPPNSRAQ